MKQNHYKPQQKIFVLLFLLFSSCEEVIDLDLETALPQLMVEGNITDGAGPYLVKLSKTGAYFGNQNYEQVRDATVVLTDNTGQQKETLAEISPGNYQTSTLQGVAGRTYILTITTAGKTYTAQSTMPYPVPLDSLGLEYVESGFDEDAAGNTKGYEVKAHFQDPLGIKNYYRFKLYLNNEYKYKEIYLQDDDLSDGKKIAYELEANYAQVGQRVRVEMLGIDKATYNYYNTLSNIIGGDNGFIDAVPDNPKSNLSNGALGYFAAYSINHNERMVAE